MVTFILKTGGIPMTWLRTRTTKTNLVKGKRDLRRHLWVELLEGRCVPSTITPTSFDDGGLGSGSLRDAVLQFNADTGTEDDTILLEAGTYALTIRNVGGRHETAGLTGDLNLTSASHRWIIQGAGSSGNNVTIIDAGQLQDRAFQIVKPGTQVVFRDLIIQGGLAQDDGSDGALAGTTDALGGGILNNGGNVTLDNVVVQNNAAQGGDVTALRFPGHSALGGGLYSSAGALSVREATIANNQSTGGRGGDSSSTFHRAGDGGSASGAGLYASGGSLDISDSTIANNRATGGRGGDGGIGYNCTTPFSCVTVGLGGAGGRAEGGGLYVTGGSLTVASSAIASNQGTGGPGGLNGGVGFNAGGGLYTSFNSGMAMVTGSTLSGNSAYNSYYPYGIGGGISNYVGTLTVSNSTLSGNSAGSGGGIANELYGTLTVSNSTLSGNSADSGGGGISNGGTLTVSDSTLSGNSAGGRSYLGVGGGIYNSGSLTVSNSTLSDNSGGFYGGGIYTVTYAHTGPVTLTNVTLTANRATSGGGLYGVYSNPPVLHNTLIAGNFRDAMGNNRDDVAGLLDPSGDYNLIGDGTGMTGLQDGASGNLVGSADAPIDPLLDALDDYGGPTKTHALLRGSRALNAGNPSQLGAPDQRGVVRSGGVNIGAYQASTSAFVLTAPATVTAGVPFDVTVTAVDPFGQVAVGYLGTVTFSTTDPDPTVVLPADYTFTLDDGGMRTFTNTGRGELTLVTPGDQMLTLTDTAKATITGGATVTVDPGSSPGNFGPGSTGDPTPVQNLTSSSASAVEHFFAALAEEESLSPWMQWEHRDFGDLTAW
jgi:hypothetical protein